MQGILLPIHYYSACILLKLPIVNFFSGRMDATLKEIGSLILEVNPDTRRRGTVFEFRLVYPELTKSIPRMKELGSIVIGQKGFDDNKTLAQLGYVFGHLVADLTKIVNFLYFILHCSEFQHLLQRGDHFQNANFLCFVCAKHFAKNASHS